MSKKCFLWLILCFFSLNTNTLLAQNTYKSQNQIEFSGSWGFYSPSNKIKSAYLDFDPWGHIISEDEVKYGGVGVSLRILYNVKNSSLKLGGEIGGFTVREATEYSTMAYYEDTGEPVGSTSFLNGNHLQFLTDLYLLSVGNMNIHTEIGFGYLVYWDTDLGFGKAPFDPASEFMSSAKLVFSIPIKEKYSIDLQFGIIKGFSNNDILIYQIHLGFSLIWLKNIETD